MDVNADRLGSLARLLRKAALFSTLSVSAVRCHLSRRARFMHQKDHVSFYA